MPYMQLMEERTKFLNIDERTINELRDARDILEPGMDEMLDKFYHHLLAVPELQNLFVDKAAIQHARSAQKQHWLEALFNGKYDNEYYEKTANIGKAHARIGLTPNWYIGSYNLMLCQFIELIEQKCKETGKSATTLIQAVSQIVFLDMDLVIHCYLEAKDESKLSLLQRYTDFRSDMWAINDELKTIADQILATTTSLSSETKSNGNILNNLKDLQAQVDQLKSGTLKLGERLTKLPLSDKLYVPEPGIFNRLKAMLTGRV